MTTLEDNPTRPRRGSGRILVLADRSPEGRSARRWAAAQARDRMADILALPELDEMHPTIPAQRSDLLVLGVHADRGNLPDDTIELIENAPCPTVVFRAVTDEPRCVTAGVTGDSSDNAVITTAAGLADSTDRPLVLVHGRPLPLRHSDTAAERDQGSRVLADAKRVARELAPDLVISTELIRAHGHDAVTRRAGDEMVVVGAGGDRSGRLGLVARAALHHSRSPVVVVKQRDGDRP